MSYIKYLIGKIKFKIRVWKGDKRMKDKMFLGKWDVAEFAKLSYPKQFKKLGKHKTNCSCSEIGCKKHGNKMFKFHILKDDVFIICSICNDNIAKIDIS